MTAAARVLDICACVFYLGFSFFLFWFGLAIGLGCQLFGASDGLKIEMAHNKKKRVEGSGLV
jgi:TRAP-type C4-dicarboxylate transport system permease small subunit